MYSPHSGDHFYAASASERDNAILHHGYRDESIACDVDSAATSGVIPLYRACNYNNGDHFYTTSVQEKDNAISRYGYTYEGIACYANDSSTG